MSPANSPIGTQKFQLGDLANIRAGAPSAEKDAKNMGKVIGVSTALFAAPQYFIVHLDEKGEPVERWYTEAQLALVN